MSVSGKLGLAPNVPSLLGLIQGYFGNCTKAHVGIPLNKGEEGGQKGCSCP